MTIGRDQSDRSCSRVSVRNTNTIWTVRGSLDDGQIENTE